MSSHIHIPLEEGFYYHIYNQGNDRANIFYQQRNYVYFLKRYDEYLSDYLKTYAYALLHDLSLLHTSSAKASWFHRFR